MKVETYLNDNLFTDKDSVIQIVDVRTDYNAFKGDVMFTFYDTCESYLIVPSYIELFEGEQKLFEVKTNQTDLTFDIDNTEIAELIMVNNKKYIKGKLEGNTILRTRNAILDKITNIRVKKPEDSIISNNKYYLTNISSNVSLFVGESVTFNFTNPIDVSKLDLVFDSNIINVQKTASSLTIVGVDRGNNTVVIKYNSEIVNCKVCVLKQETSVPVDDLPIDPPANVVVDPEVPVSSNTYYTV